MILQAGRLHQFRPLHLPIPGRAIANSGHSSSAHGYTCGTLYVDHSSGFMFVRHQTTTAASETIRSKLLLERMTLTPRSGRLRWIRIITLLWVCYVIVARSCSLPVLQIWCHLMLLRMTKLGIPPRNPVVVLSGDSMSTQEA